ncbi:MAG: hypothetical protein ACLQAT_20945 [Candidatus Binataceae bacterium]
MRVRQPPATILTAPGATVPAVIAARGRHAGRRCVEFFTANIRNPNVRGLKYKLLATSEAILSRSGVHS